MTTFEQDLLKIVLDKVLLGMVAAGFGFLLARLLENHKSRKAYELFVWQQRVDACRTASKTITEHYFSISEAHDGLKTAAEKGSLSMEDDSAKKLLQFAERYPKLRNELLALVPFLVPEVAQGAIRYLDETSRVSDIVKGNLERGWPKKEDLLWAHSEFQAACAAVIDAGPHGVPKIARRPDES